MKPIFKLCSACLGEGVVEDINPEKMKVIITPSRLGEEPTEKRNTGKCYVCHGSGYIPTGFFIFEPLDEGKTILELLEEQPDNIRKAIINQT